LPAPRDRLACRPRRPRKCQQARCINRVAEAWLHGPNKSPAGGTGLSSSNGPACEGVAGTAAGPPPQRRAAELVAQIAAMEGVGLPARAPGSGSSADQPDPSGTRQARCINGWAGGWFRRGNFASPSPAQFAFHPFARRTGLFRCALHLGFRLSSLLRFVANLVILSSCNPSPVLFSAACALLSHHDLPAKRCRCR
jgi:hypothetical protein